MQGYLAILIWLVLKLTFLTILPPHIGNSFKWLLSKDSQTHRKVKTFE